MLLSLISDTFFLMSETTALALPPAIIMTTPPTASVLPFFTTAPTRTAWPKATSATSRMNTGVPATSFTTMRRMSSRFFTRPTPRIRYCSAFCGSTPPPALALLRASASYTSFTVRW